MEQVLRPWPYGRKQTEPGAEYAVARWETELLPKQDFQITVRCIVYTVYALCLEILDWNAAQKATCVGSSQESRQ